MTVARATYPALLDIAQSLGCVGVEVRNDLQGALFDGQTALAAGKAASAAGLRILALSEVKAFNNWSDSTHRQAFALMETAAECGAEAISLIPCNNGPVVDSEQRLHNLRVALQALRPMLESFNLVGLVEPLGFASASLQKKSDVVQVIEELDASGRFKLVHDTFHHYLAGEVDFYPQHTGMVHISGVVDAGLDAAEMLDENRVLVDQHDRLDNLGQLSALHDQGYAGPVSVEAFSPAVHAFSDPVSKLYGSFNYIANSMASSAA